MPLKKSEGNMYPWVTHTHTHLAGECPHRCSYCYVNAVTERFGNPRYTGPIRLVEDELKVKYGSGKTIFVENCNDLFAEAVPAKFILPVLKHCREFPDNTYVFQSKNPYRMMGWVHSMPREKILGTTIETNRNPSGIMRNAPAPSHRKNAMIVLGQMHVPNSKRFVTIEPILDFDSPILTGWIAEIQPDFVNIGADSKGRGLVEPSKDKILSLIAKIKGLGIEIREKHNLQRLIG